MVNKASSLDEIFGYIWHSLLHNSKDNSHAYRFPALATAGRSGIQQRTVVLREVQADAHILICYTDIRAQKTADLQENEEAHWLFYDHSSQEQLRLSSRAVLHHQNELAQKHWDAIPPKGRGDYIGPLAPGTAAAFYTTNLPEPFLEEPAEANTATGYENFCVIACQVYSVDFLKLMHKGHLRAGFFKEKEQWQQQWLAP